MEEKKVPLADQETIIVITKSESKANIYSCDPVWMKKIKEFDGWKENGYGVEVDVPKSFIKVTKK